MASASETIKLTQKQRHGRAINAVAELLRKTLSVPNIYLEPPSKLIRADVLAVDRAGSGDLHAVEIKLQDALAPFKGPQSDAPLSEQNEAYAKFYPKYCENLQEIHRQVIALPAHYRYLAIPDSSYDLAFSELAHFGLFPPDGIGRLGIITIKEKGLEQPIAEIKVPAERFRIDSSQLQKIETNLLAKSRPDIEVRI